jgi:hypothetical protein
MIIELNLCTESIRRAGERSSMDLVKRNAVIFNLPEASIDGICGNKRTNSNGDTDLFHLVLFCTSERDLLLLPFFFAKFEFIFFIDGNALGQTDIFYPSWTFMGLLNHIFGLKNCDKACL